MPIEREYIPTADQEMVTLPRELVEQTAYELGRWHESLIAHDVPNAANEVAVCGAKVWALLREQYPLEDLPAVENIVEREPRR